MRKKRLIKPFRKASIKKKKIDDLKNEALFMFWTTLALAISFTISSALILLSQRKPEAITRDILGQYDDTLNKRVFWKTILAGTPDYLPGILELARIEKEIGNTDYAETLIQKAEVINPNNSEVSNLRTEIIGSFN